jgi:hypothetical protein
MVETPALRRIRPCEEGPCSHYMGDYCALGRVLFQYREELHRLGGTWDTAEDKEGWREIAEEYPCIHHFTDLELIEVGESLQ